MKQFRPAPYFGQRQQFLVESVMSQGLAKGIEGVKHLQPMKRILRSLSIILGCCIANTVMVGVGLYCMHKEEVDSFFRLLVGN